MDLGYLVLGKIYVKNSGFGFYGWVCSRLDEWVLGGVGLHYTSPLFTRTGLLRSVWDLNDTELPELG